MPRGGARHVLRHGRGRDMLAARIDNYCVKATAISVAETKPSRHHVGGGKRPRGWRQAVVPRQVPSGSG